MIWMFSLDALSIKTSFPTLKSCASGGIWCTTPYTCPEIRHKAMLEELVVNTIDRKYRLRLLLKNSFCGITTWENRHVQRRKPDRLLSSLVEGAWRRDYSFFKRMRRSGWETKHVVQPPRGKCKPHQCIALLPCFVNCMLYVVSDFIITSHLKDHGIAETVTFSP